LHLELTLVCVVVAVVAFDTAAVAAMSVTATATTSAAAATSAPTTSAALQQHISRTSSGCIPTYWDPPHEMESIPM
jgi:hypothetical protein